MITQIEAKIKEKLDAIDFSAVYDYYESRPSGYPFASFEFTNFLGEKVDNTTNKRKYVFWLLIFQELSTAWRAKAKRIIYNLVERIVESFDKDQFLGWLVDDSDVVAWEVANGKDNKKWDGIYCDITLTFDTTLDIKS